MMSVHNIAVTTPKVVPPCVADVLRGGVVAGGHAGGHAAGTPSTRWLKPVLFTSLGSNTGEQLDHAGGSSIQNGGGLRTRVEVALA